MSKKVIFGGVPGMTQTDIEKMRELVLTEYPEAKFEYYGEQTVDKKKIMELTKDADVLISWDQEMDDEIYSASSLKAYCAASIGFNAANIEAANRNGVYVANVPDYCTDEVATHAVALMLNIYRRIFKMKEYVESGNWDLAPMQGIRRFEDQIVGLMGYGRIPRAVAKKLTGFGVRIIAYDPFVSKEVMEKEGVDKVELDELFSLSDYLSLHSPLLESTKYVINKETISKMKDGVFIINTARGGLIEEKALFDALESGKIAAVGLDVLDNEPPSEWENRIISHPNAIVTGHSSYASVEAAELQLSTTAKTVAAFLRGEVPSNTINKDNIKKGEKNEGKYK